MKQPGTRWGYLPIGFLAAGLPVAAMSAGLAPQSSSALGAPRGAPWTAHIVRADEALASANVRAAKMAWLAANGEALRSRAWDAMVEVGDAALRIGQAAGPRGAAGPRARTAYMTALLRAHNQGSLEGILRVAEAFAALGDHEVVAQCLRLAERVAGRTHDGQARTRLVAFREHMRSRFPGMAIHPMGPF